MLLYLKLIFFIRCEILVDYIMNDNYKNYIMGYSYKSNESVINGVFYPEKFNDYINTAKVETCAFEDVPKEYLLDFVRGYFDRNCEISDNNVSIDTSSSVLPIEFFKVLKTDNNSGIWSGVNGDEILSVLYGDNPTCYKISNFYKFIKRVFPFSDISQIPTFKFKKNIEGAYAPFKNRPSDTGFDLHAIKLKSIKGNVHYFDTGISVEPSPGFYFDIVPRSSLSKTGWMLANSVGIIDSSYRGNIIIALIKVDSAAKDIEVPMRLVQLIPRQLIYMNQLEISDFDENTVRGDGGFGSSG